MKRDAMTARHILTRIFTGVMLTSLLVILGVFVGGVANAYWGGSGNGTGTGTTGTNVAVTLTPGSPSATLYPGGQTNVLLSVSNPNLSPVRIGSLALDTSQGTSGYAVTGCAVAAAALTFTTATNGGAGWTVPAKVGAVNGTLSVTLTNALAMGTGAGNACQGASVTVYLAAGL